MARSFRPLAVGVALVAILGSGGRAQQPPAQQPAAQPHQPPPDQPQPPPVFRGGINFVRGDVIVSDNKTGAQIADLKESDFEVIEDGKPQKIEAFRFIKLDGGVSDALKEAPREIRTDYDEEMEASRDDVRLFAIFLDDYHVRRGTSMAVRNQLA